MLLIWVVVKIMVPCWISTIIRHRIFRVPKRDLILTTHPRGGYWVAFEEFKLTRIYV